MPNGWEAARAGLLRTLGAEGLLEVSFHLSGHYGENRKVRFSNPNFRIDRYTSCCATSVLQGARRIEIVQD